MCAFTRNLSQDHGYILIDTRIHTHIHANIHLQKHMHIYTYKNIYTCTYTYTHTYIYICICICTFTYIQGVSFDWGCLYYNWGILSKNPGQSNTPNRLKAEKWPKLQREAKKCVFMTQTAAINKKKCMSNHHCHRKRSLFGTSFYAQLSQVISLVSSSFLRFACFLVQFTVLSWGFHGVRHLTCSFPYLEAHSTNLCVPWCCTSRFCMSWRGGVKQKLGDSPIKKIP